MQEIVNIDSQTEVDNTAAIKRLVKVFQGAWNEHDADKFASTFEEDADFTNVLGHYRKGRQANKELHEPLFKSVWKNSALIITDTAIRFLTPGIASVDVRWQLQHLLDGAGNERPDRFGLIHFVVRKNDEGAWLIAVMHNMDLPQASHAVDVKPKTPVMNCT